MSTFQSITSAFARKGNGLNLAAPVERATEADETPHAWLSRMIERGRTEVFTVLVSLTPDLASALLARNAENRPSKRLVSKIADDIRGGRWHLNGETIIVSRTGYLNDGQNRCSAVVEANIAVQTLIVFGVERDSRFSVDMGTVRTPGDFLAMRGIPNSNLTAAVAGYLWQIERFGQIPEAASLGEARPTKMQVQEAAQRYLPLISDALVAVARQGSGRVISASQAAAGYVYLVLKTEDKPAVEDFFRRLIDGDKRGAKDPIWLARERLMEERRKRHLWPAKALEIMLRAWNAHRRRAPMQKIQIMGDWPKVAR